MNKRNRTFSDVSIAESCIDVYTKSSCLLKHPPATDYLSQQDVSAITLYINSHYSNFNTSNILYVSKGLYTHIQDVYKIKEHDQLKIICVEIIAYYLDNSNITQIDTYRLILKDIIPTFLDILNKEIPKQKTNKY